MKICRFLFPIFLCSLLLAPQARSQELEWVHFAGGGYDIGVAVTLDQTGDAYVLMDGGSPFHAGDFTLTNINRHATFLAKYRRDGSVAWVRQIESPAFNQTPQPERNLLFDQNGTLLISGTFSETLTWIDPTAGTKVTLTARGTQPNWSPRDAYLLRVDLDGNLLRAMALGGHEHQTCTGLGIDSQGNIALAGGYHNWADFDGPLLVNPRGGHWVGQFSSNGVARWVRSLTSTNIIAEGPSMATDAAGNIIIAGAFNRQLTEDSSPTNQIHFVASGNYDLYIAKYSSDGELLWAHQGEGEGLESVWSVAVDAEGEIYLAGGMSDSHFGPHTETRFGEISINATDFLFKFDPNGNPLWAIPEEFAMLTVAPDNTLYGLGSISPSRTFGESSFTALGRADILAARLSPDGEPLWARAFADSERDEAGDLTVDRDGNVWIVGASVHSVGSVYSAPTFSGSDALIARFSTGAPRILSQPADQTVSQDSDATFTIEIEEMADATIQWLKDGAELSDGDRISGSQSNILRILRVQRAEEGDYSARVESLRGTSFSAAARLHVLAPIQFTSLQRVDAEVVRLTFEGIAGRSYRFEASDDLSTWSLVTNTIPNSPVPGEIIIMEKVPDAENQRFYRAVAN